MSDRMDKDALEKYYNYMKAYYPPAAGYPMRNPYYPMPEEDKERKNAVESYPQMYGYPPYNPYQMPPMGYPQHYVGHEHDKREEDKPKHEMPNPYAHYYPYSHYPYYNPYYPPYYYGQRELYSKSMGPPPPTAPSSTGFQQQPANSLYAQAQNQLPTKIATKPAPDKIYVKQQIIILSDSEHQAPPIAPAPTPAPTVAPPAPTLASPAPTLALPPPVIPIPAPVPSTTVIFKPATSKPQPIQEEKLFEKKKNDEDDANLNELQRDPFFIRKKPKIAKEEKDSGKTRNSKAIKVSAVEKEKQASSRFTGMAAQKYQELVKRQTRFRLELFYERERIRKEVEKSRDKDKSSKEKQILKDMKFQKIQKVDDLKGNSDDKSEKDKKEKNPLYIARMSAPCTVDPALLQAEAKRERVKDDHPLKELRYNQSHGRIRLGGYFQSNIPNLMRHQELALRRVEMQKRLREREISAVTF